MINPFRFYNELLSMSNRQARDDAEGRSKNSGQKERDLENAQNDQERVGKASNNPETAGPAENLREKAAKAEDKGEGSREPA